MNRTPRFVLKTLSLCTKKPPFLYQKAPIFVQKNPVLYSPPPRFVLKKPPHLVLKNPAFVAKAPPFSPLKKFTSTKQEKPLLPCHKPCHRRTLLPTLFGGENFSVAATCFLFHGTVCSCIAAILHIYPPPPLQCALGGYKFLSCFFSSGPSSAPHNILSPKKTATSRKQYECKTARKHVLKLKCTTPLTFDCTIFSSFHIMAPQKSRSTSDTEC